MSALFDEDDDAGLVFDDLIPEEGDGQQAGGGNGNGGDAATGELTSAEADKAEADLQAAAAAVLRPAKRRRAPFNDSHIASKRGFPLLHEMATDALRGMNPPVKIRTGRGREAEGMAACATLWRAWAQASYPGMSLADMVPKLATMSGKGQIKATTAAARDRDLELAEGERLFRLRAGGVQGGGPPLSSVSSPPHAATSSSSSSSSSAAVPTPPRAETGATASSTAPAGASASQADVLAEAEAAVRAGATGAIQAATAPGEDDEEDYAALGVDLDEFM